ncbi:carbamoyltransferase HypF [Niveibacterium sp. 24ML]|uniref:carbamoyltransferase HypF n=1 Tax=Niveibacterium sp. 24ML TaxID=2985512 RepID=UPI00226DD433|nr:carbamoyltransferase HypF [Niveibacterium sp. 24ML]MCX9156632.1 carbamoyltransferase HypF [Niveibacterium sp. 24ML]
MAKRTPTLTRLRLDVTGLVQGVGFRPFVARLAMQHRLAGSVRNIAGSVQIEVEGSEDALGTFETGLASLLPAPARIDYIERRELAAIGQHGFAIEASTGGNAGTPTLLPDTVTCPECQAEMRNPANRRYRYPFISCATCGPRYSIVEAQPFDRARTALRDFPMCAACAAEYRNPSDRRFHAQTISCHACGPRLSMRNSAGSIVAADDACIAAAADALRSGQILALKGIGGFQLLVDAANEAAVARLRVRKHRPAKPLAVMLSSMAAAERVAELCAAGRALLSDRAGPIVLAQRCGHTIAANVAPDSPMIGLMLPSSGLHTLLLDAFGGPLVVTSGNCSDLPIAIDNDEAMLALGGIADLFLMHDRRITNRLDDSLAQIVLHSPQLLRRARGYVPQTLPLKAERGTLAFGAQQKNTLALALGELAVLSQHGGDLDTVEARAQHETMASTLLALLDDGPSRVVVDANADYASSIAGHALAARIGTPALAVWHHLAHVHACIAEHGLTLPCSGIAWDGSGIGGGAVVRGGECFSLSEAGAVRIASLHPFPLPGGDRAAEEPRRAALGLMYAFEGKAALERPEILRAFSASERATLGSMLEREVRCPPCTSVGRLFDAVAFLLGLRDRSHFEGDAAMQVQFAAERAEPGPPFAMPLTERALDWRPMLAELLAALESGASRDTLAARFHATLARAAVDLARLAGHPQVVLSGGCFQNRLLLTLTVNHLRNAGFTPYWPKAVPPNDGGLALGQLAAARLGHLVATEAPLEDA